jgi:hypothetical protein
MSGLSRRLTMTIADAGATPGLCLRGCRYYRSTGADALPISSCFHPAARRAYLALAEHVASGAPGLPEMQPPRGFEVIGDRHAIAMGWWDWPYRFDPMWLVHCEGFAPAHSDAQEHP